MTNGAGIDYHAIFEAAKANRDRLDKCPRHRFPPLDNVEFGGKIKCQRCGGEMRLDALNYYVRGYVAHGGDGNDILPNWDIKPGDDRPKQPAGRSFFSDPT